MSDTPAQSHFTVEDAGTTTDPADLANHGVGHAVPHDEDAVESADEVVRATEVVSEQPPTSEDAVPTGASTTTVEEFAVDTDGVAEPVEEPAAQDAAEQDAAEQDAAEQDAAEQETTQRTETAERRPDETERRTEPTAEREPESEPADTAPQDAAATSRRLDLSALADADIGHVFDQTNGVIERTDGDSDGSGESDVLSESLRSEDDPTVVDAGVHGDGEVPETRRTGD